MERRARLLVTGASATALLVTLSAMRAPGHNWLLFGAYLAAALLSSGMKVQLLRSASGMSINFPFVLLAALQLSPLQAIGVAALPVLAQCKFRVKRLFLFEGTLLNVAKAVNATALCSFAVSVLRALHLADAPTLILAAVFYFLANTIPVALLVGFRNNTSPTAVWRAHFSCFLPFYLVGASLAALALFLSGRFGPATAALLVIPAAYIIFRSYNGQIARILDREQHMAEMEELHLRTIESLAMAIEAKDRDTHDHLLRVRVYVTEIAAVLKLSRAEVEAVRTAALLHDIGKLAVPERIINKPGKLTQEEFEKMKIHPVVGADILERVRFPYPVVPIVRSHHEWWNGMGYPDGLQGEAIPIGARILTVVDSFDAMASDRPYRRAMPLADAMALVKKLSGTQFDPTVVDVLERHYVRLEEQARREGEEIHRLETEIKVSRGTAPGAGFEQDSSELAATRPAAFAETAAAAMPALSAPVLARALSVQANSLLGITELPDYALNLEETLAVLASRFGQIIPFDCLIFYLSSEGQLIPQPTEKHTARYFSTAPIPHGAGISGWAALHQHSIVNGNPMVEPNYIRQPNADEDLQSALSLPLRTLSQDLLGVLTLIARAPTAFSRDHLRALEQIETVITLALQNAIQTAAAEVEPGSEPDPTAEVAASHAVAAGVA